MIYYIKNAQKDFDEISFWAFSDLNYFLNAKLNIYYFG